MSDSKTPLTLLRFPRLVRDSAYLFDKLEPILGAIDFERFDSVFADTVRPDWVHKFNDNDD